jgi:hypothetical protein
MRMLTSAIVLVPAIALDLSAPAIAQPKADAGSGPTSGAISTNDAGSGPTGGAKPNTGSTAASNSNQPGSTSENSAGVTPGPKSTGGAQPVTPGMSERSSQQMQTDRDRPPGDAQTPDKRGERAMTAAPPKSTGEIGPRMGEDQKPKGKVGP